MHVKRSMVVSEVMPGDQLLMNRREDGTTHVIRLIEVSKEEFLKELRDRAKKSYDLLDRAILAEEGSKEKHCADGELYRFSELLHNYLNENGFFAMVF